VEQGGHPAERGRDVQVGQVCAKGPPQGGVAPQAPLRGSGSNRADTLMAGC
jgi:hypothetical protein